MGQLLATWRLEILQLQAQSRLLPPPSKQESIAGSRAENDEVTPAHPQIDCKFSEPAEFVTRELDWQSGPEDFVTIHMDSLPPALEYFLSLRMQVRQVDRSRILGYAAYSLLHPKLKLFFKPKYNACLRLDLDELPAGSELLYLFKKLYCVADLLKLQTKSYVYQAFFWQTWEDVSDIIDWDLQPFFVTREVHGKSTLVCRYLHHADRVPLLRVQTVLLYQLHPVWLNFSGSQKERAVI
jgi:hypothetical protein